MRSVCRGFFLLLLILVLSSGFPWPVFAHGKELGITVTSLIPDPERPLVRLYRVSVVYASDMEPVEGADCELVATREEGGPEVGPVRLTPVENNPGLYVGEVTYPRFGTWTVRLQVSAAFGQGEGATEFVDSVRPGALNPSQEASLKAEEERIRRLQVFFRFDWWPDVVNVVVRIIHSIAALTYFVVTGATFFVAWFGVPPARRDLPIQLSRVGLPLALGSLGLLMVTGLYSAAFDAPTTPPGIYDLEALRQIPYGEAYLGAFLIKPIMFILLVVLAVRIHRTLRASWGLTGIGGAAVATLETPNTAAATLRHLTLLNAAVGIFVLADIAVVTYLHYISHLGIFLPPPSG